MGRVALLRRNTTVSVSICNSKAKDEYLGINGDSEPSDKSYKKKCSNNLLQVKKLLIVLIVRDAEGRNKICLTFKSVRFSITIIHHDLLSSTP